MIDIDISKNAFTRQRTPAELKAYAQEAYDFIAQHQDMKKLARLRKEPYKTFLEELLPFSNYCEWRYNCREDVLCSLVEGTPGCDGIVLDKTRGEEHSVEITWPIDGRYVVEQGRQLNERGRTNFKTWDYHDVSLQKSAVHRTLEIARKKALRDYRSPGGSTIIFVFDHSLFWDSNPQHVSILNSLSEKLATMDLQVDTVRLMLVYPDKKQILPVNDSQQAVGRAKKVDHD